ncbi:MAG: hypothetical protein FWD82_08625 [Defluviitaleaceae bacterium]|nr:hypothetical protein [Defluviitaleaceae bacterium]
MKRIKFMGFFIITCTIITLSTVSAFVNDEGSQPSGDTGVGVWWCFVTPKQMDATSNPKLILN